MGRTTKLKLFALCSTPLLISGVSIIPILSGSCSRNINEITITFYALNGGMIIGHGEQETLDMVIPRGIKWAEVPNKPRAWIADAKTFDHWSLSNGGPAINPTYVLNNNDRLWAVYVDHSHEYDSYTIEETPQADGSTIRRIKGHCPVCQKYFELSDEQLSELQGRFLIKENGLFTLSDVGVTLSDYVNSTTKTELDIYPIGLIEPSFNPSHNITLRLHGVHDYDKNWISYIDSYNEESSADEKVYYAYNVSIEADNIVTSGKHNEGTWQGGIQAVALKCNHCKLRGEMATYSGINEFKNCEFNSTNIVGAADYAVYCYNKTALFENCTFITNAKTIKIYQHGLTKDTCYEIYNCYFILAKAEGNHDAIEIDATKQSVEDPYVVYVYGNTLDQTYRQAGLDLYNIEGPEENVVIHKQRK